MLDSRRWLAVFAASLFVHIAPFVAWPSLEGARGPGEQGIEIGLGLLGDLGDATTPAAPDVESKSEQPEPPPDSEPPTDAEPPNDPEPPQETPPPVEREASSDHAQAAAPVTQAAAPLRRAPRIASAEAPALHRPAPPRNAAHQRGQAAGASSPAAGGEAGLRRSYAAALAAHLNRHKSYPIAARRQGREGTVTLRLVVDRTGRVADARITRSAGFPDFNEAALTMLARAQPLPPFPTGMSATELVVMVPVSFALDR